MLCHPILTPLCRNNHFFNYLGFLIIANPYFSIIYIYCYFSFISDVIYWFPFMVGKIKLFYTTSWFLIFHLPNKIVSQFWRVYSIYSSKILPIFPVLHNISLLFVLYTAVWPLNHLSLSCPIPFPSPVSLLPFCYIHQLYEWYHVLDLSHIKPKIPSVQWWPDCRADKIR